MREYGFCIFTTGKQEEAKECFQTAPPPFETSFPSLLMLREKVDVPLTPMLAIEGRSWLEDEAQRAVPPRGNAVYSPRGF